MGSAEKLANVKWLYHFTDTRNLPSIKAMGGLYSMERLTHLNAQNVVPGGNDWSLSADVMFGMNRYVHLCFRRNHPMEFRAREREQIKQTLWLFVDAQSIFNMAGVKFSPDVANKSGVEPCPIQEAADMIDYDVLYSGWDLRNPDARSRMTSAERCEILVPDFVPIKYFERFLPNG
jgi:hypothetical protein